MNKKRGRPTYGGSKDTIINVRINDEQRKMLANLCVDKDQKASEIMRDALEIYYRMSQY